MLPSRRQALKLFGRTLTLSAFAPILPEAFQISELHGMQSTLGPIHYASVVQIQKAIQNLEISSEEVTKAFLERISNVNPKLNAVFQINKEEAFRQARQADLALARGETTGLLHGVPMTIKDSFDAAGLISTAGTMGRASYMPEKDATIVKRLKDAGAILLGKTNTPELTMYFKTDNLVYGQTNNPYDLDHSPGGSSGGAAAIVAAGGSPFDIGTDTGGSIRIPSNYCGVCGIKPTSGRVPRTGHIIHAYGLFQSLTTAGPIARYVEDLIHILPIIIGSDGVDPHIFDIPFGNPEDIDITSLRFAYFSELGNNIPGPDIRTAVQQAAEVVKQIGASIENTYPPEFDETALLHLQFSAIDHGFSMQKILDEFGTKKISPFLEWIIRPEGNWPFSLPTNPEIMTFLEDLDRYKGALTSHFHSYDILICPVVGEMAITHDQEIPVTALSYTMAFNLLGWPAAVVPITQNSEGLPVGVQIVGKPFQEAKVLAVASFFEKEFGGFRPPDL